MKLHQTDPLPALSPTNHRRTLAHRQRAEAARSALTALKLRELGTAVRPLADLAGRQP